MIRLNGIKAELEFKFENERLGRVCHILFNTECRVFMALNMVDGVVLDKKGAKNGWVDISEICMWYNRKVNYANVRAYALKLIENDPVIMNCVKAIEETYVDDMSTDEPNKEAQELLETVAEEILNEEHSEQPTSINALYGQIVEFCRASGYAYCAVRQEDCIYDSGDWAFNSNTLMQDPEYDDDGDLIYPLCTEGYYKGFYVGPMLPGTCGIMFYDEETLTEALKDLNYSGDKITIIAGYSFEYGDDLNEVIIHNARVIAQYDREELSC